MFMLKVIRNLLVKLIDDIDTGNSKITEEEEEKIIAMLQQYSRKDEGISKYQAAQFLGISRATFDNHVRNVLLPKGKKIVGFNELRWFKKDLIKCIKEHKHDTI